MLNVVSIWQGIWQFETTFCFNIKRSNENITQHLLQYNTVLCSNKRNKRLTIIHFCRRSNSLHPAVVWILHCSFSFIKLSCYLWEINFYSLLYSDKAKSLHTVHFVQIYIRVLKENVFCKTIHYCKFTITCKWLPFLKKQNRLSLVFFPTSFDHWYSIIQTHHLYKSR